VPQIAIDYTPAYEQGGGIGRYVRELTSALSRLDPITQYKLFVLGAQLNGLPQQPSPNFIWKPTRITPRWSARLWHRARLPIPIELFTGQIDLFHATDFVLPPTLLTTKTLLTVHDLSFVRVPETASPPLKTYLDAVVPRSVKRANHILADSQATKNDLIDLYKMPESKVSVLLSGVDKRFEPVINTHSLEQIRTKYGLHNKQYILSVGTVQPRKNYSRVIRSLAQLRQQGLDVHYAIAGGKGWLEDEMYQTIKDTHLQDYVHVLGFVDDEDLPALYTSSECLIITSLYEGFGLPILEAMACGTPVITSNLSSLPEVAGDASILVDPLDIDAITKATYTIMTDSTQRNQLIEAGYQQVKNFTWKQSAKHLKSIYDMLLHS
jgi:glycosyltransferase involved in cell wall biosynthesis